MPRTHRNFRFAAALLLAAVALAAAPAGPARGATLRLSLKDAVGQALSEGTAAQLAALRVDETRGAAGQARSALYPQIGAGASQASAMANYAAEGITIPGFPRVAGPFGVFDAHVTAAMNVVDLAARKRDQLARQGVRISESDRRRAENEVAAAVAALYVAFERADARVGETEANVQLFTRLRGLAADQWRAGVGTRLDSLRAAAQLTREKQNLLVARNQRDATRLALLHAIGADMSSEVELTDSLHAVVREVPEEAAALAEALRARPEMESAAAALRGAELNVEAFRADRLPVVGVEATGTLDGKDPRLLDGIRTVAASVSMPIFTGGRLSAGEDVSRARLREAQLQQHETARQVEEEVRRAMLSWTNASSRIALAEENARLAREELETATHRYENGVSSSLEVDNAQSALSAAQESRVGALADESQAWYDFARATGRIRELVPGDPR